MTPTVKTPERNQWRRSGVLGLGLNTHIYQVNPRIRSKYGEVWTRKNLVFGHISAHISVQVQ